jgi:hypothetical protein
VVFGCLSASEAYPSNNAIQSSFIHHSTDRGERRAKLWIFREGKKTVPTRKLIGDLEIATRRALIGDREALLDGLIQSGELESALADANFPAASTVAALTDLLARAFLRHQPPCDRASLLNEIRRQDFPPQITISPAEGFAYYALSPSDFAAGLASLPAHCRHIGVIGIRSIGTTLSALATADLAQRGVRTDRITVRPTGHPFNRLTIFAPEEQRWVAAFHQHEACFLIVDEGPGMSGSSFLSVAEALEREGVPNRRIHLAGSRDPDLSTLRAPNAAQRWRRYPWQRVTSQVHEKYSDHLYFGADCWRARHFAEERWPACWSQMERLKFLSRDERTLYKFEGFGRFGRDVRERSRFLAEAGFGCTAENAGDGMTAYPYLDGRPLHVRDLTSEILNRIAEYGSYRRQFLATDPAQQQLPEMVTFNIEQEFGAPPPIDLEPLLCERPIVTDGKMHLHEWMRGRDGRLLKLDASTHGDDHFFPGPTDIAWDLAGAITEWQMEADAANALLRIYTKLSGDDPTDRLPAYLLAYSVFRMSYCRMAAEAEQGSAESTRLDRAYRFYREAVERQLACAAVR